MCYTLGPYMCWNNPLLLTGLLSTWKTSRHFLGYTSIICRLIDNAWRRQLHKYHQWDKKHPASTAYVLPDFRGKKIINESKHEFLRLYLAVWPEEQRTWVTRRIPTRENMCLAKGRIPATYSWATQLHPPGPCTAWKLLFYGRVCPLIPTPYLTLVLMQMKTSDFYSPLQRVAIPVSHRPERESFLYSKITPDQGLASCWLLPFIGKMTWPDWRYSGKKQSLMSPSVFVVGAVLDITKYDSPKTTSFLRKISQQIILVSCIFLSRGHALRYWKVRTAARLKWFLF